MFNLSLETALSSLRAQQLALDITSHNIANANTPGYTRQRVNFAPNTPFPVPSLFAPMQPGQVGTGVVVASIERVRDTFMDIEYRKELMNLGYWETRFDVLDKIQLIINEPSDTGLNQLMDRFWNAWQELSKNPENLATRAVVQQTAKALVETFNHLRGQLDSLQNDIDFAVQANVEEINSIARQIRDINDQIFKTNIVKFNANDLMDQRDELLNKLAKLIDFTLIDNQDGTISIEIGGKKLVDGLTVDAFKVEKNANGFFEVFWSDDTPVTITSQKGELAANLAARDVDVQTMKDYLDSLAQTLIIETNNLHTQGYVLGSPMTNPGYNFFDGTDAQTIALAPEVSANLNNIAAAKTPSPGDGEIALAIAQLKDKLTMTLPGSTTPTATFNDFYRTIISRLGVDAQEAERMYQNEQLLTKNLNNKRMESGGVSIDEEMANMILYQNAYSAAARIVTAIDEMMDIVINRMGIVGR
ncbi:flagellar hook-associated protein FlgK [Carboxydothermus islandicus]|uniref:Flagellar hook-associated protein 1 n=1 Tax=Carboxydothermus islandicus TaxID=661089 RepID=A0A1L8D4Z2_9THEO|nr:flagellar hook-associated protein FlgK [Carboxydothermus islandicus]GAV26141.1 flagellar hook-associated protein FlgK [Carboxydothermus islandicus]